MNLWFTRPGAKIVQTHLKRFDPLHWSVDFPRGTVASVVRTEDAHGLSVQCEFLRKGDLVGLIWESEDGFAHPAHARGRAGIIRAASCTSAGNRTGWSRSMRRAGRR